MITAGTKLPIRVSVVIPAYNEQARIAAVLRNVKPLVSEIVVVDDGSTDATAEVAAGEGAVVIRNSTNVGYLETVRRGFRASTQAVVVTIDGDGEFAAEDILVVAEPVLRGEADLVLGSRKRKPRWSEAVLNWLANLRVRGDSGTGLRALSRELALALPMRGQCICGSSLLEANLLGARITERPVELRSTAKKRRTDWRHALQLFYVLRLLLTPRQRHASPAVPGVNSGTDRGSSSGTRFDH
jgi:glycosyltransferase involved in cell wall biosynthesis